MSAKAGTDECSLPDGSVGQFYSLTLAAPTGFLLTMTPSGFSGGLGLFSGSSTNTAQAKVIFTVEGSGTIGARAFLPAGQYFILAGRSGQAGGSYTLTSSTSQVTDCVYSAWTMPGVPLTGSLTASDCAGGAGSSQDIYSVRLAAGQSVSISASVSRTGAVIWGTPSASIVERPLTALTGGTTQINYTATAEGVYLLHFLNNSPTTGTSTYSGTIQ